MATWGCMCVLVCMCPGLCVWVHMWMHTCIHAVCANNELISVTILLLYITSPFKPSLLIFLCWRKKTFSLTIMTLSVPILHISFPFLHSLLLFPFYIHQMPPSWISSHAILVIQRTGEPGPVCRKRNFSQIMHCKQGVYLEHFQMVAVTTVLSDDNQSLLLRDPNPSPFQESGLFSLKCKLGKLNVISK